MRNVCILLAGWMLAAPAMAAISQRYERAPAALRDVAREAKAAGYLEAWQDQIEDLLPDTELDLQLVWLSCGEANAYYDAEQLNIVLCYEELADAQNRANDLLHQGELEAEDKTAFVDGWLHYVFFHELGHALIDQLDVPLLGREEDVADQISTYIWVNGDNGDEVLFGTLWGFDTEADEDSADLVADVHSLNSQRFFNVMCWAYGADEDRYAEAAEALPQERREGCADEYALLEDGVQRLLPELQP